MKEKHSKIIWVSLFSANFVFLAFALGAYYFMPIIMLIHADFKIEPPAIIQSIIQIYKYWIILPLIFLAVLSKVVLKKENAQKLKEYLLVSVGIAGLIILLFLIPLLFPVYSVNVIGVK